MSASTVLELPFDPAAEKGSSFEIIPRGWCVAEAIKGSVGPTKNGNGKMAKLQWQITEGEYRGRVIFQQILFEHTSEKAQAIGRAQLKDICDAIGLTELLTDLKTLLFKPVKLLVGIERDPAGKYADKNRVQQVLPVKAATKPTARRDAGLSLLHSQKGNTK
jgi:hypothetical protein